jgi:hypothetical protein
MKRIFLLLLSILLTGSCLAEVASNFILIQGGSFKDKSSNYYEKGMKISDFYM